MEQIKVRSRLLVTLGVTAAALVLVFTRGVKLGQDLRGGTSLRFSLDLEAAERAERITAEERDRVVVDTIRVIQDRIDKYGLAETSILPLGENKFDISLPSGAEGETEGIVDVVTALGDLQFRIEVLPRDTYLSRRSMDEGGTPPRLAQGTTPEDWPWAGSVAEFDEYKKSEVARWKDARDAGLRYAPSRKDMMVVKRADEDGQPVKTDDVDAFHVVETREDAKNFTGQMLKDPVPSVDPQKNTPVVHFGVKTDFQKTFGDWTERNRFLPMAIVLNELYHSAPIIQSRLEDSVQVTLGAGGYQEKEKEAQRLATVLQTGSLKVRPILEAQHKMGAKLAGEARDRGILATIVAFCLVLIFMVVYYKAGGLVANLALLLNLVLLVGLLAFFRGTLTLPGIAGIVLTIGMAVDANILINERMFEERRLGRTVRRAISEGYDRAFTTIVDANVTSLITALFLYVYGSGPIKGFAVTLAIGLAVSMFTAVYVTRMVYEGLYAKGILTEIRQRGKAIPPKIGWMNMRRIFAPLSAIGILFGLVVFFGEDKNTLYDVDFTGGYKLQARFLEKTSVDDVQKALSGEAQTVKIVSSTTDEAGNLKDVEREVKAGPYPGAEVITIGTEGNEAEVSVQRGVGQSGLNIDEESQAFKAYVRQQLASRLQPDWVSGNPTTYRSAGEEDPRKEFDGGLTFRVSFVDPDGLLTATALEQALKVDFPYHVSEEGRRRPKKPAEIRLDRKVLAVAVADTKPPVKAFDVWIKSATSDGAAVERDPGDLRLNLAPFLSGGEFRDSLTRAGVTDATRVTLSEPFPSVEVVGSSVAERLKDDALVALLLSFLGIIVYVAIRFKSRAMGISAVLCLFHDVAITLGIVAIVNALGLVDAKINLTMVAAFLTLVGFSVNDTVVVFDRIRENRGKKPTITSGMIDDSINQTLVRSLKTNFTVFLVCLALFALNFGQRNVLEGFSFCLLVGTVVGTYSTIAIASPLLLFLPWFWERVKRFAPNGKLVSACVSNVALILLTPFAALLYALWWVAFAAVTFVIGLVLFPIWAVTSTTTEVAAPA